MERPKFAPVALALSLALTGAACEAEHPTFYDGPATPIPSATATETPVPILILSSEAIEYLKWAEGTRQFANLQVLALKNSENQGTAERILSYMEGTQTEIENRGNYEVPANMQMVDKTIEDMERSFMRMSGLKALCFTHIYTSCLKADVTIEEYLMQSDLLFNQLKYYDEATGIDIVPKNPHSGPTPFPQT